MRKKQWFRCADILVRRQRKGLVEFTYTCGESCNGHPKAQLITVLDSRKGRVDSEGLSCMFHPGIYDRDGLIFMIEGSLVYASAAFLCPDCFLENMTITNRDPIMDLWSPEVQETILETELRLVEQDDQLSEEAYDEELARLIKKVELASSENLVLHREAEEVFDRGRDQGLAFLREKIDSRDFMAIASVAQYSSRRAKFIRDRGGSSSEMYKLKNECLNALIVGDFNSPNAPNMLALSIDEGQLSVGVGFILPTLACQATIHLQLLHLPKDQLQPRSKAVIKKRLPDLWEAVQRL